MYVLPKHYGHLETTWLCLISWGGGGNVPTTPKLKTKSLWMINVTSFLNSQGVRKTLAIYHYKLI